MALELTPVALVSTASTNPDPKHVIWIPTPLHPIALSLAHELFDCITPSHPRAGTWWELAEAAVVRTGGITEAELSKCKKLRIITRNGAGYDTIPIESCRKRGIIVTNLPGHNARAVAELVLGLAISVSRRITEFDRRLRRGELLPSIDWMAVGLQDKTIGLVGMGAIAREVAKKFHGAFDAPILVYSPTSHPDRWTSTCPTGLPAIPHRRVTLEELLKESDVVSLHCPLLPETKGMMGLREFGMMKSESIFINSSRGAMVDEIALYKALATGQILGAGLDAMINEPVTTKSYPELLKLENVVVLPHAGAGTEDIQIDGCIRAVRTAFNFLRGEGVFGSNIVT